MRKMPQRFSYRWWRLWFSGAIDQYVLFKDVLANELKKAAEDDPDYFQGMEKMVREGKPIVPTPPSVVDIACRVNQQLRLGAKWPKVWEKTVRKLFLNFPLDV